MAKRFICTSSEPIVQTKAGKVRGFILDSTHTFHGIKYADAKRFKMPTPVAPWEGVKDALSYGHVAPIPTPDSPGWDLYINHRFWPQSEDCQYLNVWTQSLDSDAKKPVMVWLHGGGYFSGSSIEHVAYDGDNLSKHGDVVVVSLNHRLNFLGYLDLSSFGERYANSGNLGQADIVEALKWVRENIASFGGDPDNVTIFGHSGGGGKCNALLQTPAADGLFHKAIIMSGVSGRDSFLRGGGPRKDRELTEGMLAQLSFGPEDIEKLETVPLAVLTKAFNNAAQALAGGDGLFSIMRIGLRPTPNDWYVGDPYDVGFTEHARTIPVMVGSVFCEFSSPPQINKPDELSAEERRAHIAEYYGTEHTDDLIARFKESFPDKNELMIRYLTNRQGTIEYCRTKAEQSEAPVYNYLFSLTFAVDDGKPAWHGAEMPFVFHNTDKIAISNIPGVSDQLEQQVYSAFVNFARFGNPNNEVGPEWPVFTTGCEATMIFDSPSRIGIDFDQRLMELHRITAPAGNFF